MSFFLLILLLTFFAPLQCYDFKSKYFFVTRRDTKEAICIQPIRGNRVLSTFDLDKLQIPPSGFKYWDWLADWQLQNYTDVRRTVHHGYSGDKVFIAGNQPFHFLAQYYRAAARVYILASNVSLWMTEENRPRGPGFLFELDHLNETTKLKDTTLKYCNQNPEVEGANCTIVDYKNGTNLLNDGNRWTAFKIKIKENSTGVEMNETSYGKEKPLVQCTWNETNISNPLWPDQNDNFDIFAKSHQRNAALRSYSDSYPDLSNNKEMKRKYTKRSSSELCVWVEWDEEKSNDTNELLEVKILASGQVQPAANTTHGEYWTSFEWNHLDAGEYEFTLRFDQRKPSYGIDLCKDYVSNIVKTWTSIPKAITKCQFRAGKSDEYSAGPSSRPQDPTLQPDWSFEDWEHVCDRLGIGSNDTEVQIKFCNFRGCNFSKCPHLHDDPPHIFDLATENITPVN